MRCIMSGPRPTPTALKVLKGERAPSRGVPRWEPEPEDGPLERPEWLETTALRIWDREAPKAQRLGLLRPGYEPLFAAYCVSLATMEAAGALLMKVGPVIRGRERQLVSNPAAREFARSAEMARRLGAEFGRSPAAAAVIGRNLDGSQRTDQLDPSRLLTG